MWLFCCSQNSKMFFSVLAGNVEIGAAAGNSTYNFSTLTEEIKVRCLAIIRTAEKASPHAVYVTTSTT